MKIHRPFWLLALAWGFVILLLAAGRSPAETPARSLDPSNLSSPMPVCFVKASPSEVLISLEDELKAKGYGVTFRPDRKGELLANKSQVGGSQDRFLVWLGRDLDDCSKLNIFVQYAKFDRIFGKGLRRVVVEEHEEEERIAEFMKISDKHLFRCEQQWHTEAPPP